MIGIIIEKDAAIPMRDGLKLASNIYRPEKPGQYPVIMAFTGFGKDGFWGERHFGWQIAYEPGSPTVTGSITFEANDPAYWVPHEYVVIIVDPRGFGRSPGQMPTADLDGAVGEHALLYQGMWARDMYDAIEWAGTQEWSNGNVGLSGVSILAFSQWRVAGLNPPHLKAINPWEAMTDFYRDVMFPGGIPETKFTKRITNSMSARNPAWPGPQKEEPPTPDEKAEDEFLGEIAVPALICGTWADHGVHTRGSFRAFRKISSKHKWLYTHGRQKWAEFYSAEARTFRKLFFDHFLKGIDERILTLPRIRLEVRETLDKYTVRWEDEFPLPRTEYRKLYLDATDGKLKLNNNSPESKVTYDSANGKAEFVIIFEEDTELTGYLNLKLWVSADESNDMDLFITARKLDRNGNQVLFDNCHVPGKWPMALGWLRLSHRELDQEKSTLWEPYLKSVVGPGQKVRPGEIVSCEIPILPTSTLFRRGETLKLEISGIYRGGERVEVPFGYTDTVNKGIHSIYTGGKYDSYLLIPLVSHD
jgi:predicted acyl esterase